MADCVLNDLHNSNHQLYRIVTGDAEERDLAADLLEASVADGHGTQLRWSDVTSDWHRWKYSAMDGKGFGLLSSPSCPW